jgi:hypothetical protein
MTWRRFCALLSGLSAESMWRKVATNQPVVLSSEQARSVIANM